VHLGRVSAWCPAVSAPRASADMAPMVQDHMGPMAPILQWG
jgi:hypothetical protein